MNERIKELAIEAGVRFGKDSYGQFADLPSRASINVLEAFADLIAADERESCAKVADWFAKIQDPRCRESYLAETAGCIRARSKQ